MIRFNKLWENHPTISGQDSPCSTNGKSNFSDQCAIKVGVSLSACGVNTTHIPGVRHCWFHEKSDGHVLAAEELGQGLKRGNIAGIGKLQKIDPKNFKSSLSGKKGIIFFKDYWARNGETIRNKSGDHIDLWNGSRLTDWKTWARIQLNISWEGSWSDYKKSKEIWFWAVN
jgi:hypothetical protein